MTTDPRIRDRALGCFIGLAVGDALGSPAEFKELGEFEPITTMRYSGVWRIPAGYWTDDTSMALCLADSIIEHDAINHLDILERFCRWYQRGENSSTGRCFDIGNTTKRALEAWIHKGIMNGAPTSIWESGNGSIMRLAPVAVRWFRDPTALASAARAQSAVTHGSEPCILGCEELADLLGRAIRGEDVMPKLRAFAAEQLDGVPNTGYVVDTMISAKWAVGSTASFDDAVLAAANLGGDADTIAAVTGQIAGAIYGLSGIRTEWLETLHDYQRLLELAMRLHDHR
jgi:ADP-ribosyl-[dinitrogen reductase] hydrolase